MILLVMMTKASRRTRNFLDHRNRYQSQQYCTELYSCRTSITVVKHAGASCASHSGLDCIIRHRRFQRGGPHTQSTVARALLVRVHCLYSCNPTTEVGTVLYSYARKLLVCIAFMYSTREDTLSVDLCVQCSYSTRTVRIFDCVSRC